MYLFLCTVFKCELQNAVGGDGYLGDLYCEYSGVVFHNSQSLGALFFQYAFGDPLGGAFALALMNISCAIILREPYFLRIEMLDDQGVVVNVMPENAELLGINRCRREFFSKLRQGKSIYWSNSFVSVQNRQPTVLVAIPMQTGVLVGYLDLQMIGGFVANYSKSYSNSVTVEVTDARGITIAHSDPDRVLQREWSEELFALHMQAADDRQAEKIMKTGTEYLISVSDIGMTGWHVIVAQTAESAFAVLKRIQLFFFLTALLVLVIGTVVSWRKIFDAVHSLSNMNQSFTEVAAGNFQKHIEPERFVELNEMAGHVNHMIACIRERDERLQKLAQRDVLTGLGNRTFFLEWLRQAVDEACPFALIYLDLDNFNSRAFSLWKKLSARRCKKSATGGNKARYHWRRSI